MRCRRTDRLLLSLLLLLLASSGCASQPRPEAVPYRFRHSMLEADRPLETAALPRQDDPARRRRRAAIRCMRMVGRSFPGDHRQGQRRMIRTCLRRGLPARLTGGRLPLRPRAPLLADLVLFHNTLDINNNGEVDDRYSDAGVVVRIDGPRVRFVYLSRSSVRRGVLNLNQPNRRRVSGARIQNSFLRIKRRSDPPGTRYLAGQLLAGFATLE